ncbi:MAG: anti-sigma factor domain-containing protein [Pirellulaceae bacterium]
MSMHPSTPQREHLDDLLIMQAVYGLSDSERVEMDKLARQFDLADDDRFEVAIAALDLAAVSGRVNDEMPDELRQRVLKDAPHYVTADDELSSQDSAEIDKVVLPMSTLQPRKATAWTTREKLFGLAAAASLLIALASLLGLFGSSPSTERPDRPIPSVAQQYQDLLDTAGSVSVAWTVNDTSAGQPFGQVLWNNSQQKGFMLFEGLAVNDPAVEQYQLWIFDTQRSDELPVDGGVFDVTSEGQVIIPIDARLPINQAKMFAITIEQPGGVVKSDRERLPLLAVVEQSAAP